MADSQPTRALTRFVGAELAAPAPEQIPRAKHLAISSAHVVRSALKRAGTHEQLALCFDRPRQRLSQWADPAETQRHPNTVDLAVGPSAAVVPILRWIAAHHDCDVLPRPRVAHGDNHWARFEAVSSAHATLLLAIASCARGSGTRESVREAATVLAEVALEVSAWSAEEER